MWGRTAVPNSLCPCEEPIHTPKGVKLSKKDEKDGKNEEG